MCGDLFAHSSRASHIIRYVAIIYYTNPCLWPLRTRYYTHTFYVHIFPSTYSRRAFFYTSISLCTSPHSINRRPTSDLARAIHDLCCALFHQISCSSINCNHMELHSQHEVFCVSHSKLIQFTNNSTYNSAKIVAYTKYIYISIAFS